MLELPTKDIHKVVKLSFKCEYPFIIVKYIIDNDTNNITDNHYNIFNNNTDIIIENLIKIDFNNILYNFLQSDVLYNSIINDTPISKLNNEIPDLLSFIKSTINDTILPQIECIQNSKNIIINAIKNMQIYIENDKNQLEVYKKNIKIIVDNYAIIFNYFGLKNVEIKIALFEKNLLKSCSKNNKQTILKEIITQNLDNLFLAKYIKLKNNIYDRMFDDRNRDYKNSSLDDKVTLNKFISFIKTEGKLNHLIKTEPSYNINSPPKTPGTSPGTSRSNTLKNNYIQTGKGPGTTLKVDQTGKKHSRPIRDYPNYSKKNRSTKKIKLGKHITINISLLK